MDAKVGAKERVTQNRVIGLFKDVLRYNYLGNLEEREGNSNIEQGILSEYLTAKGYTNKEIHTAVQKLKQTANNISNGLYNANKEVYTLLRYGVNVHTDVAEKKKMVHLIDWQNPKANTFQVAEEVTINGNSQRRPDIVVYVNGIALAVIELKRSTVSVHKGIRQNIRNQEQDYIPQFFTTIQLLFAGNDTEGLHYGVIKTPEKFWLRWKEPSGEPCIKSNITPNEYPNELDRSTLQFFDPTRFLEYIHDFIAFDGGIKKTARPNQYFAIKAAQPRVMEKMSGIIWHSQGAGKSLTMVWLAQWIHENVHDARVVIITDRDELDGQIENTFKDANEKIERAGSGSELIAMLNNASPWLICTLIHKFGNKNTGDTIKVGKKKTTKSLEEYLKELLEEKLPSGFSAKGNIFVFVDECHRTQGGMLHQAMKHVVGDDVMLVGFTGTPLLKTDKKTSLETFGSYIHSYKFNEAVNDHVILDLRYEARNVEQNLGDKDKIDDWFEAKTKGLSKVARATLKERWAKMEKLFSSKERIERIVADICYDMTTKPALLGGYGNAMLVADSIYQAFRYWKAFQDTELQGHCAVVTSYSPSSDKVRDEYSGEDETEELQKYIIANTMLNGKTMDKFEEWAKSEFVNHPGSMKLLIVVDKLLTGFDAPSATYLYIDKKMRDHNLFQAICRVNRVDNDLKDFGYIVDYQDLFGAVKNAIQDYTSGAFDKYDEEDVKGLLTNRLEEGRKALDEALQAIYTMFEEITPATQEGYFAYFVYRETTQVEEQQAECETNANKREVLYKLVSRLVCRYIDIANEMQEAGYSDEEAAKIKNEVEYYNSLKDEIKLKSGDGIDLKLYDPAMRRLIDNYVRADDSEVLADLADMSFLELIDERGDRAIDSLPKRIKKNERSVAEILAANMRKIIINERPTNPAYFDKMSELLNALLKQQKDGAISYKKLIDELVAKIKEMRSSRKETYPDTIQTDGQKAIYDNLDKNEELALKVYRTVKDNARDGFRENSTAGNFKMKKIRLCVEKLLKEEGLIEDCLANSVNVIIEIIRNQKEF